MSKQQKTWIVVGAVLVVIVGVVLVFANLRSQGNTGTASTSGGTGTSAYQVTTVQLGTGGTFDSCDSFTADLGGPQSDSLTGIASAQKDFDSGGTSWAVAGGTQEAKTYRDSWFFDTATLTQPQIDALQGTSTGIDLVWELQNN